MMADGTSPEISIIVPVYNVEQYLRRCLDSIRAQTFTDWECILIDDGSPDASGTICDEYAAKDCRFRVIHQENRGVSAARNAGLDAARGEWIAFVDSDDWIEQDTFEVAYGTGINENADIVQWDYKTEDNAKFDKSKSEYKALVGVLDVEKLMSLPWYFGMCWLRLYKKEIFSSENLRFPPGISWYEDAFVSYLSLAVSRKTVLIENKFYHYFYRPDSAVNTLSLENVYGRVKCLCCMESFLKTNNITKMDKILMAEKTATKNIFLLRFETPCYDDYLSTFPEVSNSQNKKWKVIDFLVTHHLKFFATSILFLYKKCMNIESWEGKRK